MKTEEKTQHTKEPWRAEGFSVYHRGGGDIPRKPLAQCDTEHLADCAENPSRAMDSEIPEHEAYANARRIVAAVNACEGISTEDLESGIIDKMMGAYQRAIAAMRKAKGE